MAEHSLSASAATVHWGYFDATRPAVIEIDPGDEITVGSVSGGPAEAPRDAAMTLRPELAAIHATLRPSPGPHILTGPIGVRGAEPGDALRIEILDIALADDWGYNWVKPGKGALPDDFPIELLVHFSIDRARRVVRTPWGHEIPARPFFGVMGVAPPLTAGRLTSVIPGAFGGNIDNKELTPGAVLYLPVMTPRALLSFGDGHAAQGDGEVCLTAVETGLVGRFRIDLVRGAALSRPHAETATHLVAMAFDEDLDEAMRAALRALIAMIVARTALSREDAYRLCSLAADFRITQVVNVKKGVHAMLPLRYVDRVVS
jgi:acetamidase/formamidase